MIFKYYITFWFSFRKNIYYKVFMDNKKAKAVALACMWFIFMMKSNNYSTKNLYELLSNFKKYIPFGKFLRTK